MGSNPKRAHFYWQFFYLFGAVFVVVVVAEIFNSKTGRPEKGR
jgi:hypothetical protein